MNTTINTGKNRTYDVLELDPRASKTSVGQVAAVSRSAGSVHITMTEAAAEALAAELSWALSEVDPTDQTTSMWEQIAADLRAARELDTAVIPPSKWQASIVAGFDGTSSSDVVFATVLPIPHEPKHRAAPSTADWPTAQSRAYVPRHAKTADEIEASR